MITCRFFLVDCQGNVISGIERTHFVLTVVLLEREHKNTLFSENYVTLNVKLL